MLLWPPSGSHRICLLLLRLKMMSSLPPISLLPVCLVRAFLKLAYKESGITLIILKLLF